MLPELQKASDELKRPSKATLKKYGLSLEDWEAIAESQGYVCYICRKLPKRKFMCVDHHHAKGFKKMPPEEKRKYVRGLLCSYCNLRLLPNGMNLAKAERIVLYLKNYEARN